MWNAIERRMNALWRHMSIHVHLRPHLRRWLTMLDEVRLHRMVSGCRGSHHSSAVRISLHLMRVDLLHLARMKRGWRTRPSLLLFLNGDALDNGPHPSFSIPFYFCERVVLRQIVAHTTLPSICTAFEDKVRILSLDSSVYLRQGHLASR
jgi:hypothetical protein